LGDEEGSSVQKHKTCEESPILQAAGLVTRQQTLVFGREDHCSTINKATRIEFKCQNATWCCVLPHVLRYITPNCISKDQLTLNWKNRAQA
jgi:hypothetical protein